MMRRAGIWGGASSGNAFAALLQGVVSESGRTADVYVAPVSEQVAPEGAFLVEVSVDEGPSILFEVADWIDGARIMDPDGEDLSVEQAPRYVMLRINGASPVEALKRC